MKVLIGYDGSACSDAAIDDLQRAGLPKEADAVVLTAAEIVPPGPVVMPSTLPGLPVGLGGGYGEELAAYVRQSMERAASTSCAGADRVKKLFPGWTIKSDTMASSASSALVSKADAWKAELLVVGSHSRSAVGRLLLGSVAQSVLHHAHCSVHIGRAGKKSEVKRDPGEPVRIVLGMDGSEGSLLAAKVIGQRRWPAESQVRVIAATYVTEFELASGTDSYLSVSIAKAWQDSRRQLERMAQEQAQYLRDQKLAATPVLADDSAAHVLIKDAETWGADLIFVGARGLSRLERLLLGSVSNSVAARAHCSVEVVR